MPGPQVPVRSLPDLCDRFGEWSKRSLTGARHGVHAKFVTERSTVLQAWPRLAKENAAMLLVAMRACYEWP